MLPFQSNTLFCIEACTMDIFTVLLQSTRDMLLMFSKDYLHREGDLVKHLTYLGYSVSHVQVRKLFIFSIIFDAFLHQHYSTSQNKAFIRYAQ